MRAHLRPTYVVGYAGKFRWPALTGFERCEIPDDVLPLDALRGLSREVTPDTGVYFLWRGPQLIYAGSTIEGFEDRMFDHGRCRLGLRVGPVLPYTHVTCMPHGALGLRKMEYLYIEAYKPPCNGEDEYAGKRDSHMNSTFSHQLGDEQ
ncbi:MAG TPA: hypothetical protein VHL05_05035 [Terriglobales bacterium]|jgi:hypothetical protein|nr:hypothetical protein [Terriglobales bacterium]